jgi:DNA-binding SARP family transcriptional activator
MTTRNCGFYPDFFSGHQAPRKAVSANHPCQPWPEQLLSVIDLLRAGRYEHASTVLAACETGRGTLDRRADCYVQTLLLTAHLRMCQGERVDGLEALRLAFALGRERGVEASFLCQAADIFASLCAVALEEAIEPAYVGELVKQAGLSAPSPALTRWPFPVRLYTLGRAAIVVDGQPLRFSGKAQRRPMLLLHCLLARGGRSVPVQPLLQAMWEERDDGRDTRGAFDMALSRLRRLLGVHDALLLGDGRLSLNESICWVDAWACERLLGHVDQTREPACGQIMLERALALYQGDFLEGEETAWTVLNRERMRARLLRVARRLGEAFEHTGQWAEAGQLYEQLRELFPLDEALCRHLIRSHIERDELAQATGLYSRCRALMAKVLGVLPSPAIRALLEPADH